MVCFSLLARFGIVGAGAQYDFSGPAILNVFFFAACLLVDP